MSRILRTISVLLMMAMTAVSQAQVLQFSQPHGFYDQQFTLIITADGLPDNATIYYTLDGSEPSQQSMAYVNPIVVKGNTILRAAAADAKGFITPITTATYLFVNDVLSQSNTPAGYPGTWGKYTDISGTAKADYEMDPEMTTDKTLRPKIIEGLKSLPVLSIVTDKDYLFSHENDPDRGGIYIFTGPPVGDDTGHGWTRPTSIEMFTPTSHSIDFSTTCGLRLHGGHGRLAEKNPKHSFRLVFKEQYGPKSLKYPLYGENEPKKFDQLVLRCHFGNAWQHWNEGNRQKAQYTRDVWARRMQRKMGHTSVNALYVNLFINGMYWGLYNLAERVDDQFGKDHIGGEKTDIDVVKIEESGGNHLEASEGDMAAWEEMVATTANAADEASYAKLDTLLDIDAFIDYMLINQYGGNTDWDHHNWYAIRRRGADSEGFRFLCWDSEIIFENLSENVLSKNNGQTFPTGIFHNLMSNQQFARRYVKRAKQVLADDGLLGQQSVVGVWDSLYHTIEKAIYAEAARWGDYRRDVHRWQSAGQLYTVDEHYMAERNRLLTQYFPYRTGIVLDNILAFAPIDDFEAPEDWVPLKATMFHQWNGTNANAQVINDNPGAELNFNRSVGSGGVVAGFSSVGYNLYADISQYDRLVLRGTGGELRILANRQTDHGEYKQIVVSFNEWDPYWDQTLQAIVLPLADLRTAKTNQNKARVDNITHLNAMKVQNGNVTRRGAWLVPAVDTAVGTIRKLSVDDGQYYNLNGQKVAYPVRGGVYICNGRKVVVK